ncbi:MULTISPECIES: T9SS type B sorting domain-containing protein [Niastella]|uniref:Gliding motility-associated C-terminal domain-containing protein n=1 Tax=Niastella soli TaxID=2821487 RepID=A0ABS3YP18_9BACT|nr:gliding motility-associated C-terminal domain-containing protein [Niastella soli]MBO9199623.1 gliding motility-associated C-terminal domain-containing protein [Niastella soli]
MKKSVVGCLLLLVQIFIARADHITGGEMHYTFTGITNGMYNYQVTAKLFMDCYSNRRLPDPAYFGIFNKGTGALITNISIPMAHQDRLTLSNPGPCITNPPSVCYDIGFYDFTVSLPPVAEGYVIVIQVVYRVQGISNLVNGYGNIGATYTGEIPGNGAVASGPENNSARFNSDDMVVICANNSFSYSFAAVDKDNDQLRYSFTNAYVGGAGGGGVNFPPSAPPYIPVPYGSNYGPGAPLGGNVKINSSTGVITGIAPGEGIYVVTVQVEEIRNGVVIATQRKDLQIRITTCTVASASMPPDYMLCKNSQTIELANLSTSPLITSTTWELINNKGVTVFNSNSPVTSYTFSDTGVYTVKLVINRNQQCSDSTISQAYVFPGFKPDFNVNGICFKKPTQFFDATVTSYGSVNSWDWNFDDGTGNDFSLQPSPTYTYQSMGIKNVRLIATNTKGCRDTTYKNISIVDKPPLSLAFRDTLICIPDALQLQAMGNGVFSWTPGTAIVNGNTATPTVNPATTTTYTVQLDDNGCLNRDSVQVRVVDHVTLLVMNDTTICQGDTAHLHVQSDGLRYNWTPANQVLNATVANPDVVTRVNTIYQVTASIGSCIATEQVQVITVPYPVAIAGSDTTICFDTRAQLQGNTEANRWVWLPSPTLSNRNVLDPVASPKEATAYVLSVYDNKGCPKPGFDTIVVSVLPDIKPFAGKDTAVVVNQLLQLQASGGKTYQWVPAINLSNPTIANPTAMYAAPSAGIIYKVLVYNEAGCVDSAYIKVKVFQTVPTVFVPNAFTPNGDGKNDLLRPIAVGIAHIDYFEVFNRWGQLVFRTSTNEHGWDGTIAGKLQPSGTYVWMVKAVDYTGAPYVQRGTLVLVR